MVQANSQQQYYYGTGRRKKAIARVRVYNSPGGMTVNGKPLEEVFPTTLVARIATAPLTITNLIDKVTVVVKANGGGVNGQAGAVAHGLARALTVMDENL